MKKDILELDKKPADRCLEKVPMVGEVSRRIGWAQVWDATLDLGWKTVKGLQQLSRALSHHTRGGHPCHLYDTAPLPELSVLDHILVSHGEDSSRSRAGLQEVDELIRKTPLDVCLS